MRLARGSTRPRRDTRTVAALAALAGTVAFGGLATNGAASSSRVVLPGAVPRATMHSRAADHRPAGADVRVRFRLYLAGRSPASELAFATAVSEPGSELFRHFLSPAEFERRFGPTAQQVRVVEAWAATEHLAVTGANAHYVAVSGTAPAVSNALDTTIDAFGGAGYAPVSDVSVPSSIASDVIAAVGLDDDPSAAPRSPSTTTATAYDASTPACSTWWGQHAVRIPAAYGRTSAPTAVCGYTPQQLRSAYGVGRFTGKGATIAILLDGRLPTMKADADRFFAAHHLPGFAKGQYAENLGSGFAASCPDGQSDLPEEPLDVETAHIIAPAANIVFVAANCSSSTSGFDQAFLDAATRIVDQHLADVATDSYSIVESTYPPAVVAAWTKILEQGAAEGIGFNFDSGDGGDNRNNSPGTPAAVTFPASDPWATAVGGTTLMIGHSGQIAGQIGWGDTIAQENRAGAAYLQTPPGTFAEGSTGGRSSLFGEPAYQRGVVPRSLSTKHGRRAAHREVPDVAADASPITGWLIAYTPPGGRYQQIIEGGTSGSSPIIAALEADAKQAAGRAIGFANPTLYALRRSAAIHDIVAPKLPGVAVAPKSACFNGAQAVAPCLITLGLDSSLRAAPGYDDVSGVGAATARFIETVAHTR